MNPSELDGEDFREPRPPPLAGAQLAFAVVAIALVASLILSFLMAAGAYWTKGADDVLFNAVAFIFSMGFKGDPVEPVWRFFLVFPCGIMVVCLIAIVPVGIWAMVSKGRR